MRLQSGGDANSHQVRSGSERSADRLLPSIHQKTEKLESQKHFGFVEKIRFLMHFYTKLVLHDRQPDVTIGGKHEEDDRKC